jgi:hypothetical protein
MPQTKSTQQKRTRQFILRLTQVMSNYREVIVEMPSNATKQARDNGRELVEEALMEPNDLLSDGGWSEDAIDHSMDWEPVKGRRRKAEIKLVRNKDGELEIVGYDQDSEGDSELA